MSLISSGTLYPTRTVRPELIERSFSRVDKRFLNPKNVHTRQWKSIPANGYLYQPTDIYLSERNFKRLDKCSFKPKSALSPERSFNCVDKCSFKLKKIHTRQRTSICLKEALIAWINVLSS